MNKRLIAMLIPLAACSSTPPATGVGSSGAPGNGDAGSDAPVGPVAEPTPDACLNGQDMDAEDVDVSLCPEIPSAPAEALIGTTKVSLGAWEMGTTAKKDNYKYGQLSAPGKNPRSLQYCTDDTCAMTASVDVNAENLECWAKGYYRLRKILQDPPVEYLELRKSRTGAPQGYQFRFFQFQTDLRNGPTGYRKISSFQDHLVKWVTVINAQGACEQPTLTKFRDYAIAELKLRKIPLPTP
jgi:hypothetical protein